MTSGGKDPLPVRDEREGDPGSEESGEIGQGGPTDRIDLRGKTGKKHETSEGRG